MKCSIYGEECGTSDDMHEECFKEKWGSFPEYLEKMLSTKYMVGMDGMIKLDDDDETPPQGR